MTKKLTFIAAIFAAGAQAYDYFSGETRVREPFTYGKFKSRVKAPNKKGTVTAMFLYWDGQGDMAWRK